MEYIRLGADKIRYYILIARYELQSIQSNPNYKPNPILIRSVQGISGSRVWYPYTEHTPLTP